MAGIPGQNRGNQFAKGNKGGGRKSKYQEMQDATFLWDIFLNKYSTEEIKKKLRRGKFSVKDMWISKLVGGNDKLLAMLVHKLFPDRIEHSGALGILSPQEIKRLKNAK